MHGYARTRAHQLLLHPGVDMLSCFDKQQYDDFRHLVMELILATGLYPCLLPCLIACASLP